MVEAGRRVDELQAAQAGNDDNVEATRQVARREVMSDKPKRDRSSVVVSTDPVMEAIARKLHGINRVPLGEQHAMIERATRAGAAAMQPERETARKLAEALRVAYQNAIDERVGCAKYFWDILAEYERGQG